MSRFDPSRRSFLRVSLASAAAVTIAPVPVLRSATAGVLDDKRFLVVINMLGGNDGLNMVVPAHLQPYYDRRPTIALSTGLHDLDGRYALHPSCNWLKQAWDGGNLRVVNKVGYPQANLSHFTSRNIFSYGVRDYTHDGDGRGWLGRFADAYCSDPAEPLGVISVGMGRVRDLEADEGDTLALNDATSFSLFEDRDFRTDHALRVRVARSVLANETEPEGEAALTVFGTSRLAHELVDRVHEGVVGWTDPGTYPNTTLGRRMKAISELLHARESFHTKVFYTGYGGFDTHATQLTRHADLLTQLDDALEAFAVDLANRSLWQDCAVIVISEFGRRNFENGSQGTDHGHGNAWLVAGGGMNGSGIIGELSEADLNQNQPDYAYDFREVYADLIENHLGASATPIFPETYTTTGDVNLIY